MKALTQSVLAAAMLMALPFASAEACNKNAWLGNTAAAAGAVAGGPRDAVPQPTYEARCSLATSSGQFVTDDTPGAESVFRARFAVFTGVSGGTAKVFRATTADANGGTEVFSVDFTGSTFAFPGTGAAAVSGISANRWYQVEVVNNRTANTFEARVRGAGSDTVLTQSGAAAASDVGSASLGFISGSATGGRVVVDAYESTRAPSTVIGFLCRGDTNIDGTRNVSDVIQVRNMAAGGNLVSGQADFNEDGNVNVTDVIQVRNVAAGAGAQC